MGAIVVHAAQRPGKREIAGTLLLAAALGMVYTTAGRGLGAPVGEILVTCLAMLGFASLLMLGGHAVLRTPALAAVLAVVFSPLHMVVVNRACF